MSRVFADTVGLVAVWNRHDQWFAPATAAFHQFQATGVILVTTSYVLLECGNALARTSLRDKVDRVRLQMEAAGLLIHPTAEDWRAAWQAYQRGEADQAGIVDHVSFVVMRRLNIRQAFSNDHHFRAAGFETAFD